MKIWGVIIFIFLAIPSVSAFNINYNFTNFSKNIINGEIKIKPENSKFDIILILPKNAEIINWSSNENTKYSVFGNWHNNKIVHWQFLSKKESEIKIKLQMTEQKNITLIWFYPRGFGLEKIPIEVKPKAAKK